MRAPSLLIMNSLDQTFRFAAFALVLVLAPAAHGLKFEIPKELQDDLDQQLVRDESEKNEAAEAIYLDSEKEDIEALVPESGSSERINPSDRVLDNADSTPGVASEPVIEGSVGSDDLVGFGRLAGQVFNKDTGEPVRGVAILIEGTDIGTVTDLEGRFRMKKIPAGMYTVSFIKTGFIEAKITDTNILEGELMRLDFSLPPRPAEMSDDVFELQDFVVTAEEAASQNVALLALRQQSIASIDAISAEDFAKFAASDAAEALSKVTGATVSDGKYAVIRGLNDRFNTILINGVRLPSPDPDRQAVPLDLFPSGMFSSLVTRKTFTSEYPGDSSGGSVDLKTKSFPEEFTLKISFGVGDGISGDGGILMDPERSSDDFLAKGTNSRGFEADGSSNYSNTVVSLARDYNDDGDGETVGTVDPSRVRYNNSTLDQAQANGDVPLNFPRFAPEREDSRGDFGMGIEFGDTTNLRDGIDFGYLFGFQQKHKERSRTTYKSKASFDGNSLESAALETEERGTVEDQLSALLALGLSFNSGHELYYNYIFTRVGESSATISDVDGFTSELRYTQRELQGHQFGGEHYLLGDDEDAVLLSWSTLLTETEQLEPDIRAVKGYTQNETASGNGTITNTEPIATQGGIDPVRFQRETEQSSEALRLDFELPEKIVGKSQIKFGFYSESYDRDFRQLEWTRRGANQAPYFNGPDGIATPSLEYEASLPRSGANANYIDVPEDGLGGSRNELGGSGFDYYRNAPPPGVGGVSVPFTITNDGSGNSNPYEMRAKGESETTAYHVSGTLLPLGKFQLSGGLRFEDNSLSYADLPDAPAKLKSAPLWDFDVVASGNERNDVLPFISAIYDLTDQIKFRFAYSQTIGKPSFREIAPFPSLNVTDGTVEFGNPGQVLTSGLPLLPSEYSGLEFSEIDNRDVRVEWSDGEALVAISYFNKRISQSIERVAVSPPIGIPGANSIITYINNENSASVNGWEFEARTRLSKVSFLESLIGPALTDNLTVGFNYTYIDATVDRSRLELDSYGVGALRNFVSDDRALFDQPEEIGNFFTTVDLPFINGELTASASFVGETLDVVGTQDTHPDLYLDDFVSLNFVYRQQLTDRLSLKITAKNVNSPTRRIKHDEDFLKALSDFNPDFNDALPKREWFTVDPEYSISLTASF